MQHQAEVAGERVLDPSELAGSIVLQVGEPYRATAVSESIEKLFATGRYSTVRATADLVPGGVSLTFLTTGQYFVGDVRVMGVQAPPSETQLQVSAGLPLGSPVSPESLESAAERMKALLEEQGYYHAGITWAERRNPDTQQSSIQFEVQPGERARLGQVVVEGSPRFPQERLLEEANWKLGKRLDSGRLQEGLRRLREMYREQGFLQARVEITKREFHADTNLVDWWLTIEPGTHVDITVAGAELSPSRLRSLLPVFQEGAFDEDLIREGEEKLRNYFEAEGFFDAVVVAVKQAAAPDLITIQYQVTLGERHRLSSIRVTGNRYFRDEAIFDQLQIETPRGLARFGRFNRQMLEGDLIRIRSLYAENGFSQASVKGSLAEVSLDSPEDIAVQIEIDEGPQTLIGEFVIEGMKAFSEDELRGIINADSGQPYSESMVTSDGNAILTFYLNEGYPDVRFRSETAARGSERDLKYIIEEGTASFVSNIFVGDLKFTRPGVVNRQIQFRPGEPISQGRLLDTQRRLYDLGIFSRVEIGLQNPNNSAAQKNVLIYLEEARRYTFQLGLGAEIGRFGGAGTEGETEFSPDVSMSISRLNFGGRPHTVGLRARFSALQRRAGFTYTAPRLFNAPWLTGSLLAFYDDTRDVKTFTARRWEGTLQFETRRSRRTTVLSRYSFRRVSVDENSLRISRDQIPLVSQPVLVGLAGLTWLTDTRDSAGSPTRGSFYSLDLALAAKQLGSETSFVRSLVQHASYHKLPLGFTFVRSTQFGAQTPFGKARLVRLPDDASSMTQQEITTRAIPISERFFTGGGSSHRGYGLNQAGPRDLVTGFAVGGNALLVNTFELRHQVWQNLVGVLFHDMGNVFASVRNLTLMTGQDSPTDFKVMTHALGLGVRYETAVAPIRFDVGYTANPTRYQVVNEGLSEIRHLSRWQFLFSVGQTF